MAQKKTEKTVKDRIKSEKNRLTKIFKGIGPKKMALLRADIENLAFYTVMCEDMRDRLVENGVGMKYQNGSNQYGEKLSPEAETVDKWSLRIDQITGRLISLVPQEEQKSKLAELMAR